jgi:glycosyltransferase involved in cell wall biosynthesis
VTAIGAHAAGLPVVTTRVGGMASEVADGETGYVCAPGDEAELATAVARGSCSTRANPNVSARRERSGCGNCWTRIDSLATSTRSIGDCSE